MNAKTCKRMRRYIKSLGLDPANKTVYTHKSMINTVTLPYKTLNPKTLTVHPQTFRAQYQKLKKMVKQNKLNAPIGVKKPTWVSAEPTQITEILETATN